MPGRLMVTILALVAASAALAEELFTLSGPLIQGALVQGRTSPGADVRFDGRAVRVSANGVFL